MKLSASKNRELIEQHPFLKEILSIRMEPFDGRNDVTINDLTIKVEKADENLMFRRADNVGLGDSSCVFSMKGDRSGQVMRRGEYIFAVDANNKIINRVDWPRNDEDRRRKTGETYAWTVLWGTKEGDDHYSNPISDNVKFLVWATVEAWHTDIKNDSDPGGRFGEFHDRTIRITIYREPKDGFHKLQNKSNVYENLVLDSRLMIRGVVEKNYDIVTMGGMLYEMCITFKEEVYFNGMKAILDGSQFRGASGQFGPVKVLAAEMCGYDRVMLEDAMSYISFQLRPDSKNLYVLGHSGTLPQIRNLVKTVVGMWNQKPELREAFKPDQKVSVM